MGRASRKGSTDGSTMRTSGEDSTQNNLHELLEKYQTEGSLQEREWLDVHSLQHGINLEELPHFFRLTLQDLPSATREKALQKLSEDAENLGRIDDPEEILALVRENASSEKPELLVENKEGLRVHLDREYRPHNTEGPAVIWPNGTQGFYEHGREVRDGRPCRIYADGSREYWDSYNETVGMNIYKKINPDGDSEWLLETGKVVRRVSKDGQEKIFPGGILGLPLQEDPYKWAGRKFHNNKDAYDEEREKYITKKSSLESTEYTDMFRNLADKEHTKTLLRIRHPFSAVPADESERNAQKIHDALS